MTHTLDAQGRSELSAGLRSPEGAKSSHLNASAKNYNNESGAAAFETFSRTSAATSKASPGGSSGTRQLRLHGGFAATGSSNAGGGPGVGGGEEQTRYLQQSELTPLGSLEFEWRRCQEGIRSSEWAEQFEACNTLRRVCAHHTELLTAGLVRSFCSALQVQSDSLR